ncbi:glycosyltransferase family 2 protein [Azospirillum sp. SYSU D00513]|uniref:glycosyltransferase family 2 protein n=1 Tax=Azospirillum sp. SYSU D00513 TaxID=2812561 RepID=UPI001A971D92|nr:glycosyltransferase family 2 protein [Azospirillum sp. SYSU D00513]
MDQTRGGAPAPKVSVIMGAYNAARCIGTALESALAQSLPDIEILVVDDGSSDGTAEAVARAAERDGRLVLLRLDRNLGPSAARNRAIGAARGEWVTPLDADDRFAPDRLARLVREAERTGADLVVDNLLVHDLATGTARNAFPDWPADPYGPMGPAEFSRRDRPSTDIMGLGYSKPLIRRGFLQDKGVRYAEDIRVGEDFDLYMRCLIRGARLFFVNAPLYHYTRSTKSLSKADSAANFRDFLSVNGRLLEEARGRGDRDLVRALADRQVHLEGHLPFMAFREALGRRDLGSTLKALGAIPSYRYAVSRLASAGTRRLLGRAVPPGDGRASPGTP